MAYAGGRQATLDVSYRGYAVVEDAGCQSGVGESFFERGTEMIGGAGAAAGDHGNADRVDNRLGELQVEAATGAVAMNGGEQDLAGAEPGAPACPFDTLEVGSRASAMRVHAEADRCLSLVPGVDAGDDALAAEARRGFGEQRRVLHSCRVDAYLVGAGAQHTGDVIDRVDAAAYCERYEEPLGSPTHGIEHRLATFMGCGDVEKHDFIGSSFLITSGQRHRVSHRTQAFELHTLDHFSVVDIETNDNSLAQHRVSPRRARARPRPWC